MPSSRKESLLSKEGEALGLSLTEDSLPDATVKAWAERLAGSRALRLLGIAREKPLLVFLQHQQKGNNA